MKGVIKCIKTASNQCILSTYCINKNVKHGIVKYSKVEDFKKGTVGGVTSNQKIIGYLYCFMVCTLYFWLHVTPPTEHFLKSCIFHPMLYNYMRNAIINATIVLNI